MKRTIIAAVAGLAVACGGSSKSAPAVVHMDGQDVAASTLSAAYRGRIAGDPAWAAACRSIKTMTPVGAYAYLRGAGMEFHEDTPTIIQGATTVPGQRMTDTDALGAVAALQDACR